MKVLILYKSELVLFFDVVFAADGKGWQLAPETENQWWK